MLYSLAASRAPLWIVPQKESDGAPSARNTTLRFFSRASRLSLNVPTRGLPVPATLVAPAVADPALVVGAPLTLAAATAVGAAGALRGGGGVHAAAITVDTVSRAKTRRHCVERVARPSDL